MITYPMVHLNGTSREELVAQQIAVVDAARKLLAALANAMPHGRDYYPLGPDAYSRARAEHLAEIEKAQGIIARFTSIAYQIRDGA